jgi:hypothetical protein
LVADAGAPERAVDDGQDNGADNGDTLEPDDTGLAHAPSAQGNRVAVPIDEGDESSGGSSSRRPLTGETGAGDDPTSTGEGALPAGQIPPPLTEDEINAMDEAQLRKHLNDIAKARRYVPSTDKELDERLKKEFSQILARLREVQKGGA